MLTGSSSLEQFWQRTRKNLSVISSAGNRNFWLFESSVWLHMLANSMLAIYIPILMLQTGFTISAILFFYFVFHLINTPCNYVAAKIIEQIGARRTIIIATMFQIGFFLLYSVIQPGTIWGLIALGALAAVYDALYYTASLFLFMQTTIDVNNSGKHTGILHLVIRSASLVGPVVGSSILLLGGNPGWVIMAVIMVFVLSIIPLFWTSLEHGARTTILPLSEFVRHKYVIGNHLSLGLFKIHESIATIIWPVFIYLYFGSLEAIAVLAIMIPVISLGASLAAGYINLRWRYYAIAAGAMAVSLIWIGRISYESGTWYYASVALAGVLMILMQIPIDSNIFRSGNESNPLTASMLKNIVSMGVKTILFFVLWTASLSFDITFAIAAAATFALAIVSLYRIYLRKRNHTVTGAPRPIEVATPEPHRL